MNNNNTPKDGDNVPSSPPEVESARLLRCKTSKPGYATFPESHEELWKPSPGLWWIETCLWANVFLAGFDGTVTASTYAAISSDFNAANNAAWLTTSYLITSTAFQPLYGRLSDMFGRRICFFVSTVTFMLGCLGCATAPDILTLNLMRALTGFGGGGLITMATVINSDMIPFKQRGMYQAMQNILVGFGAVLGASLGGVIAESIGWRWCFLLQVPVSLLALVVGYRVLENPEFTVLELTRNRSFRSALQHLDVSGASFLVVGLVAQLAGLSFGGNEYPWASPVVVSTLVGSTVLLAVFVVIEAETKAIPMIPLRMLKGWQPIAIQLTNIFAGMSSYAYMFMIPLYLQAVRGDSPTAAGLRLIVPSLATPVGSVIAGSLMHRGYRLCHNVRIGTALMLLGNVLACTMGTSGARWKEFVYMVPANLGIGLTNPSVLFSFISLFEHREQAVATSTVYLLRSMGTIYGVTVTSSIVQNVLLSRLPAVLGDLATDELVEKLRKSIFALRELPLETELAVRALYDDALRIAFVASSGFALLAFVFSLAQRTGALHRKS
ncbi:major facilitator superfamily domain-containing protein [Lasiosphaeria miniovina]|uniref:Major facilitator superfamily domain-containing protein n=1 Tax=Lasiosphaeria miniovina TaxID=1954250 RepID=A0AA40BF81_9PEZI|nr:major facilitator superfamily domain-containing protein [Lasiosphaeria miniovina]KAK0733119.1 major facilitator superfamily domain-containing protein [Lasiosphaeria miniovina]